MTGLVIVNHERVDAIIQVVLDGLTSDNSRRAYGVALREFMGWYTATGQSQLDKATVQGYKAKMQADGLAPSTINLKLSAVRKLASEAADNGVLDQSLANGIGKVRGVKTAGTRVGNWLTQEQAQRLLNVPDVATVKGLRDRAVLAVMVGCGLRRSEVAALTVKHVQQREGRWVIVDLVGKGLRVRSVPMPSWAKAALAAWTQAAGITDGLIFRATRKGGHLDGESMTPQAIADVVRLYSAKISTPIAAHDLRRTFAKLAHKGSGKIDQIQLSLGHASIKTTERYLGVTQDLQDAPCDHLGLRLAI
jgi:site-specific recombinase XerD